MSRWDSPVKTAYMEKKSFHLRSCLYEKNHPNQVRRLTRVDTFSYINSSSVTSCELRVESLKSRVEIQKCVFKSTSYQFKLTSYAFNFTSYEFKSTSHEFKSTSFEYKSTSFEFKSTSSRIVKSMKTQVPHFLRS